MATTTNVSPLKINYLTQAQYDTALANNQINADELYFTPAANNITINLNGANVSSPSFYAPTSAGTSGYVLTSSGGGAPTWTQILPIANGGTGLSSSPSMLVNLASTTADTVLKASPRPGVTGTLAIGNGGTGITSNPSMLINLASTTAASVFTASPRPGVTGTLPIANGGTGKTTAEDARVNLGAGKIYVQTASPTGRATDLWIDTSQGTNYAIAKYWNTGSTAWVTVKSVWA